MKIATLVGLMTLATGVAGTSSPARAERTLAGRWQGSLLRDGRQVAISVDLDGANRNWSGRLSVDEMSTPLEGVRVTPIGVHFEVPGEGIFDGTVAGDSMAGSVSGSAAAGSFSLARETQSPYGDAITSSGP